MSDMIPIEIQEIIIKRLPVKSLLQFRSVSKTWKSLIDSADFIKSYSNQQQHLLVREFPSLLPCSIVNIFQNPRIIGSSHGLLCLYGYCDGPVKYMVVLWNISIRKAVAVAMHNLGDGMTCIPALGFGVCPETTDPKIVKITHIINWEDVESIPDVIPWQVEVFTLSTGAWRSPHNNLPRTSIQFGCSQVVVNGFCYWLATDRSNIEARFEAYSLIISFHLTTEEFREISLPHSLVYDGSIDYLNISNLRESLVVLELDTHENVCYVWLMKDGVSKSFTKLYTIYSTDATLLSVLEFRKSGEPIIEILDNNADPRDVPSLLAVYEPKSKHISNLGINGTGSFYVYSYVETLLLLDQPELTVFDKAKGYNAKQRTES